MQTRSFSEGTLRGSKSEQKQKHPPYLEDLHVFRGVQGYESGMAARIRLKCDWITPTCKHHTPLSFLSLRHTARSIWPILSSRTFVSIACAVLDPLFCHVSYGFLTGLAFVVYWGIILFGYDTYVEWLHSDWMISF